MNNRFLPQKGKIFECLQAGKRWFLFARNKAKKIKLRHIKKYLLKKYRKISRLISDAWKPLIIGVPSFLFCYYIIGALISENIDITPIKREKTNLQTLDTLGQILKREVDEHIWTLNLPLIFPARILDNMPNFQRGVLQSVRDSAQAIKNLQFIDEVQKKSLKKASKLLNYPADVWILAQKSAFSIAPSSNSQYRKARKEFEKANAGRKIFVGKTDLQNILEYMANNLQKTATKNEERVREFSGNYVDFRADNVFYFTKGYAFVIWQISEALAIDFKEDILAAEAYADWTLMTANLRKATEFNPLIVRNGVPDSFMAPNHLLIQNYYLAMARAQAEKILKMIGNLDNATTD